MLNVLKFLKPYTLFILLSIAFLFGEAFCELALPNYLADIVNVGIQQRGFKNSVPEALSSAAMNNLTLFMNDTEKELVTDNYALLDRQSLTAADYSEYIAEYPELTNTNIYKLDTDKMQVINELDTIFGKSIYILTTVEKDGLTPILPSGIDVPVADTPLAALKEMTPDQLAAVITEANSYASSVPDDIIFQTSINYMISEYEALGISTGSIQTGYIWDVGKVMLLVTLGGALAALVVGFFAARISGGFARDLRRSIFEKVESFSSVEFDRFSTGSFITRSTNDIQHIQMMSVMLLRTVFFAPILGIGGIINALSMDLSMSWTIALAVIVVLGIVFVTFTIAVPKFRLMQKLIDKLNIVGREILSGTMVIRAFNTQEYEEKKFDKHNVDLTNVNLFLNRILVLMPATMLFLTNGVCVLIVWIGAYRVDAGAMQVGNMMAFMQYAMVIIQAFMMISMIFIMLPRAIVSIGRINEVLITEPAIKDSENPVQFPVDIKGHIEFQNVSFKYPGAKDYIIKDISFTAQPGQTTAIIGSTGSGKSTIISLIPRFYDATEGQILIDGVNITEVKQHDLRAKIGYVPQKSVLFTGTIETNIKYGREEASDEELERAASIAQAIDFIEETKDGFDTEVSQGGSNFSGGQQQRLSIARALANRPEIFIFDDSFSALDFTTDAALRKALKKETRESTRLIVTQRIGTIMDAEQIIVLDKGRVVSIGTHEELMEKSDIYREIAQSQLSKEYPA